MGGAEVGGDSFVAQLKRVFVAFLATRLLVAVAGLAAPLLVARPEGSAEIGPPLLAIWARWDGPIYLTIAQEGYFIRDEVPVTAFFPLYSFLIQLLTLGTESRELAALAGVVISNVSLLVALAYVVALGRLDFGGRVGQRAAVYYLVAPTTLFLSAVYTESLFLALSVGAFYHSRRGDMFVAGLLGLFATLTRPYGALLALPLLIESRRHGRSPLAALLPPLGVPVFFGWLWLSVGDPFAWFSAQADWGRHLAPPWEAVASYFSGPTSLFGPRRGLLDLGVAVILVALTVLAVRRLPLSYGVLAAATTALLVMSAHFQSMPRWALTVFPVFFLIATWQVHGRVQLLLVGASFLLALLAMARFAQWQWLA